MTHFVVSTTTVDSEGRLLVPAEALRAAGISDCLEFVVDADPENGQVTLSASPPEDDDSWVFTPEDLESLERAKEDSRAGRVRQLTESQIRALMQVEDA